MIKEKRIRVAKFSRKKKNVKYITCPFCDKEIHIWDSEDGVLEDMCGFSKIKRNVSSVEKVKQRYISLQRRAKKRNMEFNLTIEYIEDILKPKDCYYCHKYTENITIDRKDNNRGYTIDNTVPACKRCNTLKSNWITEEQMRRIIKLL